jgi:environmental stress-induced protein Ves
VIVIRPEQYRRMPWKNGGGSTTEIAIHPEGVGLDEFGWRVSMATVNGAGPFSLFPGIDRTLTVLQGNGIRLDFDDRSVMLDRGSPPLSFPADVAVYGAPIDGPITDLNVMIRRSRWRHSVTRGAPGQLLPENATMLIFALGDVRVTVGDQAIELPAGFTLRIEESTELTVEPAAAVLQIALSPI